jgi:hypothetical protein
MRIQKLVKYLSKALFFLCAFFLTGLSAPPSTPIRVIDPDHITQAGKLWIQGNILFVNDKYVGVHIYDISDPAAPLKKGFILISNNIDIAVKDNTLYADSYGNLLVYDLKDYSNAVLVKTVSNAVTYNYDYFGWYDGYYDGYYSGGFGCMCMPMSPAMPSAGDSSSGVGGSTARFTIYNNQYLYVLKDGNEIRGFDISVSTNPTAIASSAYIPNFDAETLFPYQDHLFVGASTGVYIYSLTDPMNPKYVSQMIHVRAYDPVVVQSNTAYVTLRNAMEYPWNRLEIIDLNDYTNMAVLNTIPMSYPYGLTVRGIYVYVCDGYNGIEICDVSNPLVVSRLNFYPGFFTHEAIAYGDSLFVVTDIDVRMYSIAATNAQYPAYLSTID